MKLVWRRGTVTVRDVYEALLETRRIAYTTVMTMMNILETKGYLKKEKHERAEFVGRVFDGASRPLLLHLVKEGGLTAKEREELMRIIKGSSDA